MIELKEGINWHNFNLDCKPEIWFKRTKKETVISWLSRIAYQPAESLLEFRQKNEYWLESGYTISLTILSFLRENNMQKETLEDLIGFELDLRGKHDWKLSEIKKLEKQLNKKLL